MEDVNGTVAAFSAPARAGWRSSITGQERWLSRPGIRRQEGKVVTAVDTNRGQPVGSSDGAVARANSVEIRAKVPFAMSDPNFVRKGR